MKYKELLNQLKDLTQEQLELEMLVMIRDKEKFVSPISGLFFITEFDEYEGMIIDDVDKSIPQDHR